MGVRLCGIGIEGHELLAFVKHPTAEHDDAGMRALALKRPALNYAGEVQFVKFGNNARHRRDRSCVRGFAAWSARTSGLRNETTSPRPCERALCTLGEVERIERHRFVRDRGTWAACLSAGVAGADTGLSSANNAPPTQISAKRATKEWCFIGEYEWRLAAVGAVVACGQSLRGFRNEVGTVRRISKLQTALLLEVHLFESRIAMSFDVSEPIKHRLELARPPRCFQQTELAHRLPLPEVFNEPDLRPAQRRSSLVAKLGHIGEDAVAVVRTDRMSRQ